MASRWIIISHQLEATFFITSVSKHSNSKSQLERKFGREEDGSRAVRDAKCVKPTKRDDVCVRCACGGTRTWDVPVNLICGTPQAVGRDLPRAKRDIKMTSKSAKKGGEGGPEMLKGLSKLGSKIPVTFTTAQFLLHILAHTCLFESKSP